MPAAWLGETPKDWDGGEEYREANGLVDEFTQILRKPVPDGRRLDKLILHAVFLKQGRHLPLFLETGILGICDNGSADLFLSHDGCIVFGKTAWPGWTENNKTAQRNIGLADGIQRGTPACRKSAD